MNKLIIITLVFFLTACASTPPTAQYSGKTVGTFGVSAGCGTLVLDQDCSQMSGSTRKIEIAGIKLRAAGGNEGKVVFLMAAAKLSADEKTLLPGAKAVEEFLSSKGTIILETKVMITNNVVLGVHYTLDNDGYSHLKLLSIK